MPFRGYATWYRVTGQLSAGTVPLVVVHGGPGATHDYLDRFRMLAGPERAVVHYDQLGCGRSTHLPGAGASFWTVQLFLEELDALLSHLGIQDRYALLGQSWGGMLAAEHAVRQPAGLRALVIADSPASMATWVAEANRLRAELPEDVQRTLQQHEQAGTTDSPAYQQATELFYQRHVCRLRPMPEEVIYSFSQLAEDPTVYQAMNGPNEFYVIGSLRSWTIEDRLGSIRAPTLVISGRFDEATPLAVAPYVQNIPGARWELFAHSSHMPHVEETERCMAVVRAFLEEQGC